MTLVEKLGAKVLLDISLFSRIVIQRPLRRYQLEPARAIVDSILNHRGLAFAIMMSRQAGKNELSAQLEAYLLNLFNRVGGFIVKAAPTYKPQIINSIMRLEATLNNPWNTGRFRKERGYMLALGEAHCAFFSAQPSSNVVGATANILLECDEAQDVDEEKWYKDFAPMAASTNATTVFYGTAWTSRTLLAKVIKGLRQQEAADGIKRVFTVPWERVADEVPRYGRYVKDQISRLGRNHPLVMTQYFLETIDAQAGMFPEHRQAQMRGHHKPYSDPRFLKSYAPQIYAMLIDIAGEDEAEGGLGSSLATRDSTALTVVEVDLSTTADPLIGFPTYRVVHRREWLGVKHSTLYATLLDLAVNVWDARHLVIDATGVGAGLASFLVKALGEDRVIPFIFTSQSKSQLGWDFLAVCDTGRFKDHAPFPSLSGRDQGGGQHRFWQQVKAADYEILPGPGRVMRWGVSDPHVHDDLLISATLCAVLDKQNWTLYQESVLIEVGDVLEDIDRGRF